ncbi:CynX/NimT family MFS transporter [Heyndrickxia sp. NPDC080065]|uniref:CynX/NimT family MFS transporter n=1 Tax=Heyndrickxia sp. NPDC080065 TaxID=3390568 RepID=UPI003D0096A9
MSLQEVSLQQEQSKTKVTTKAKIILLIIGIILIGANLRAPLTSVGPLIGSIRENFGISNAAAGSLTTVPLIAFALLSPFAPKLSRRFGIENILFFSLIFITAGIVLRYFDGVSALFTGTILIGLGIAICNVLLPSMIKQNFSQNVGVMTGVYSVSMNLFAAISSGLSLPMATKFGLHGSLGYWAIFSIIAILFWIPQIRSGGHAKNTVAVNQQSVNLWKSSLAWKITFFMGLQSLMFYTFVAWLPEILGQQGISSNLAGWMLSLMQFAVIPFTFIVPIIAGKMKNQLLLVTITALFFIVGLFGILIGNVKLIPLFIMMVGIASGSAFSLAMMFFSLRTKNSQQAAELSGMAQSFGYLLAAIGPALFGILHDVSHSWTLPLWVLIIGSFFFFVFGIGAGKNKFVLSK